MRRGKYLEIMIRLRFEMNIVPILFEHVPRLYQVLRPASSNVCCLPNNSKNKRNNRFNQGYIKFILNFFLNNDKFFFINLIIIINNLDNYKTNAIFILLSPSYLESKI